MKIVLRLEGQIVDLTETINFPLNRTFEELYNPTTIINDWSKTIKIPFTTNNDKLFAGMYDIERNIATGVNNRGIYFNPSKKINFDLLYNNEVIMTGYAKLNDIDVKNRCYNINLFGELGNTFQEMLKCVFYKTDETLDDKYVIENPLSDTCKLNKEFVIDSYENNSPKLDLFGANDTDIIGFFPTEHGYNKDFDSQNFQLVEGGETKMKTFAQTLNERHSIDWAESIIPDGLTERQFGEFRSYYQKPYVYFNKLWQLAVKKSEDICRYPLVLDKKWFNEDNPYYKDLVYVCADLNMDGTDANGDTNRYQTYLNISYYYNEGYYSHNMSGVFRLDRTGSIEVEPIADFDNNTIDFSNNAGVVLYNKLQFNFCSNADEFGFGGTRFSKKNAFVFEVFETASRKTKYLIVSSDTKVSYNAADYDYVIKITPFGDELPHGIWARWIKNIELPISIVADNSSAGQLHIQGHWLISNEAPFTNKLNTLKIKNCWMGLETNLRGERTLMMKPTSVTKRSNRKITMASIWNPDVNMFSVLLNYAKMFGLVFITDNKNRRILVTQRSTYFRDYKVLDWTDKIDVSEEYTIKQPTFENKYIVFNYDEVEGDKYTDYQTKYRIPYGSKRLITSYEFNNEEKTLFEGVQPYICGNRYISSWNQLYSEWQVGKAVPQVYNKEIYMENANGNDSANIYSCFAFRNQNQQVDTHLRGIFITDDTPFEVLNDTYCYVADSDLNYKTQVFSIPKITYFSDNVEYGSLYNLPMVTYFKDINPSSATYIYDGFWRDFIDERYNEQNKVLTLRVNLTPADYRNFQFNNFIKINNTLYIVNKIKDFDLSVDGTTEVELITIRDLSAYQYGLLFDYYDWDIKFIPILPSYSPVLIENVLHATNDWTLQMPYWMDADLTEGEEGDFTIHFHVQPYVVEDDIIYLRVGEVKVLGAGGEVKTKFNVTQQSVHLVFDWDNDSYNVSGMFEPVTISNTLNTNVLWNIQTPNWVEPNITSGISGINTISFTMNPYIMDEETYRTGTISGCTIDSVVRDTFVIRQQSIKLYDNKIYYTASSSISSPNVTTGFGANFVGNTYNAGTGEGIWQFSTNINSIPVESFSELSTLSSLKLPYNLSNLSDMQFVFYDCNNLTSLSLPTTLNNVTNMVACFAYCSSLTSIELSGLSEVKDIQNCFEGCTSISYIGIAELNNLTKMNGCFSNCKSLTSIELIGLSKVETMGYCFYNCNSLSNIILSGLSNVTSIYNCFDRCSSLTYVPDGIPWNNFTTIESCFFGCESLKSVELDGLSNVQNMSSCFAYCHSLTSIVLNGLENVTNMGYCFQSCNSLTSIVLSGLSNVTTMVGCFDGCRSLTSIELNGLSNVTSLRNCFLGCSSLTSIELSDLSSIKNMGYCFNGCSSLSNIILSGLSNVTTMLDCFSRCTSLSTLRINGSLPNIDLIFIGLDTCTRLTRQSLVNVLNALPKTGRNYTLTLGTTNLNKLTASDRAIATNKGWILN